MALPPCSAPKLGPRNRTLKQTPPHPPPIFSTPPLLLVRPRCSRHSSILSRRNIADSEICVYFRAALQLVLITEVSIGTSVWNFILRGVGTTIGCIWGWAAVEARGGNPIVCAAMIFVALFPCAYVQLGTQYPVSTFRCKIFVVGGNYISQTILCTHSGQTLLLWLDIWVEFHNSTEKGAFRCIPLSYTLVLYLRH